MYVTAHRVWSRTLGKEGVHAFYYRHPEPLKTPVDVAWVADQEPGEFQSSIAELPVGGNEVRSYLDVAARSEVSLEELDAELRRLADAVAKTDDPHVQHRGNEVASRFYASPFLIPSRVEELEVLSRALRRLYERRHQKPPLVIVVEQRDQSTRLSLDPESAHRIRELLGRDWQIPPSVTVDHDTREDFETIHGSIFQHLIPVLTALDTPQIEAIGGVRFKTKTGSEIQVPRSVPRTTHVVGHLGLQEARDAHGNTRSGNMYEVLIDDATETTEVLGADLIEQEKRGDRNVEWNGFPRKP